jgi:hypothetical protein
MLGTENDAHSALPQALVQDVTAANCGTARYRKNGDLIVFGTDCYLVLIATFAF